MQEAPRTFSYTAQRGTYLTTIGMLLFLLFIEAGGVATVMAVLIHPLLLNLLLLGAMLALYLLMILYLLAPVWTKHRLSSAQLQLHYGFAFNVAIPRAAIVRVEPVRERLTMFQPLMAQYDAKQQRIVAAFSEQGQVLLHLDKLYPLTVRRTTHLVDAVLINVDAREEFLSTLNKHVGQDEYTSLTKINKMDMLVNGESRVNTQIGKGGRTSSEEEAISRGSDKSGLYEEESHKDSRGDLAIKTEGLMRRFGGVTVVDNLQLAIRRGEMYGFLGSNGAGKTTAIKMLVGLLEPSDGHAWIAGYDMWAEPVTAKQALGYVADRSVLYERLTGREFLTFLGQLRGLPRQEAEQQITRLLELLELAEYADRPCGAYSFGMRRKLSLAGALLHNPQVLILDEPLNGLDPRSARRLKDLFIELASGGTTILLSTHDLATAESMCHRVGIIHKGRLLAEGSASELRQMAAASDLEEVFLNLTAEQSQQGVRV